MQRCFFLATIMIALGLATYYFLLSCSHAPVSCSLAYLDVSPLSFSPCSSRSTSQCCFPLQDLVPGQLLAHLFVVDVLSPHCHPGVAQASLALCLTSIVRLCLLRGTSMCPRSDLPRVLPCVTAQFMALMRCSLILCCCFYSFPDACDFGRAPIACVFRHCDALCSVILTLLSAPN